MGRIADGVGVRAAVDGGGLVVVADVEAAVADTEVTAGVAVGTKTSPRIFTD
ncbi:hypothetical protein SBA7_340023 [Candidatus Sulfotelmatobacter sp. SbA7]|nr:hypothetical protein SBA7_340023 [Candidatus Sulfotelmatobacter sp. SbA7]